MSQRHSSHREPIAALTLVSFGACHEHGGLLVMCSRIFPSLTSVSGLGMKTGGLILRVKSRKSHSSITYCTGILRNTHNYASCLTRRIVHFKRCCRYTLYLESRLTLSSHNCSIFAQLRGLFNFSWPRLSICGHILNTRIGKMV